MENVIDIQDMMLKPDDEDPGDDYVNFNEKMFSPIDGQTDESAYGVWHEELKAWMDLNTLKGLFFNDEWVFIIIDRIASKIAAQEVRVITETFKDGQAVYEPDEAHPLNELLYAPNENQTYYDWMYSLVVDHCLTGNAVVYYPTTYPQLIHIPVEMVQLDFDTNGKLRSYRIIQYNTNYEMPVPREVMTIDPKQVCHIRRPNPSSALWGLSPFIPARKSVLFNRYSLEYLNNFYLKGAQPGMVLDLGGVANEKNALRMLRSMELAHTGRKNQRRNMVLPKGVTATTITQSLADQQLKDYIVLNRETIINILQIPKEELSISQGGSKLGGHDDYKTALRNFWSGPLKSIMKSIEASLTKLLKPQLGPNRYIEFDLTDVEFLQDDLNQKSDLAIKMLQTHTLNEVRAQIFDDEPLPGGDVTPAPKPIPVISPPSAGSNVNTTSTPIPEVKAEVTPEDKPMEECIDHRQLALDKNLKAFEELKLKNPSWWNQREAKKKQDEVKRFGDFHAAILSLFADQTASAVKIVKKNLRQQGFKSYGQKDTYNKAKLKKDLEDKLNSFASDYAAATLPILQASLDIGYDTQLILPFGLPNRATVEALRSKREQSRSDMLENSNYETFKGINETSTDKIMSIIEEGVSNGRTLDQIADNIIEDASNPVNTNARAMTITRTEVLSASSLGQAAAMQDASEVLPDMKKMWINAGDARVRGNPDNKKDKGDFDHWTLGGEVVNQDDTFSNGLSFPRDPNGEAGDVINCRCDFTFFSAQDADAIGISGYSQQQQDIRAAQET